MQAKNGILVTLLILVLIASVVSPFYIAKTIRDNKVEIPEIVIPEVVIPDVDNEKLNKLCELTDGCEFYEGSLRWMNKLYNEDAEEDFLEWLEDYSDIDEEDLSVTWDYKDAQVRAYSEDDMDDENWELKAFVKFTYWDIDDEDDKEKVYLVITSVLDEGEYDSLTVEEVTRRFEF